MQIAGRSQVEITIALHSNAEIKLTFEQTVPGLCKVWPPLNYDRVELQAPET